MRTMGVPGIVPPLLTAFGVPYIGLLAKRWCFYAQARHPQNLCCQGVS